MFFSCILPVYNTCSEYLENCIQSILSQTFSDYEIIIVDDGSDRETAQLCDLFAEKYDIIHVIHQENQGLPGARNTGILNAKGDWLLHIDSDDWIAPSLLNTIHSTIKQSHLDQDIVFWGYSAVNGDKTKSFRLKDTSVLNEYNKQYALMSILEGKGRYADVALNTTWGKAYKRSFVIDNQLLFNLELRRAQDVIYNLYAFSSANAISYADTVAHYYRLDNESLSRGYNDKTGERLTKTALAALSFLDTHPEYQCIQSSFYAFCRTCFRIIVNMDYINPKNPDNYHRRQLRYNEMLNRFPYKAAYSKEYLPKCNSINALEHHIISLHHLWLVKLFVCTRNALRTIIK